VNRMRIAALLTTVPVVAALVGLAPVAAEDHSREQAAIVSHDGTVIAATVYRPAGASAAAPVPMILHSHGWGGSRTDDAAAFRTELDAGFGVLSFDQRGFGETPGRAGVQDPDKEGRDVITVVDHVAGLDWVAKEPASPIADDPVLFAMGGSYGGGYQLVGAFTEMRLRDDGLTRFDALAPEITWYDLPESLAPAGVARSAWLTVLYAAGLQAHEDDIHVGFAYGSATGQWPDGSVPGVPNLQEKLGRNGPVAFVEGDGLQLDIPLLVGQGASDNLFNLNQGWKIFERAVSDTAREQSIFIGYNGGHALPNVLPAGYPAAVELGSNADVCSPGGFGALRLAFFQMVAAGENPRALVGSPYSLMTADGDACITTDSLERHVPHEVGVDVQVATGTVTTTGAGAPQHLEIAAGPLTVAGVPRLDATVSTVGADQRVFFALSVGPTPAQARVVHNNMMPLRELLPVVQEPRAVELPGLAVDVPEGQTLYLTISPISDISFGHGSVRTPGVVVLEGMVVQVPVIDEAPPEVVGPGRSGRPKRDPGPPRPRGRSVRGR
jgi:ABC-2 type transport system ATP-binding protein